MAQLHTGIDLLSRGDALLCAPRGYVLIHANWWNPHHAHQSTTSTAASSSSTSPYTAGGFNYETAHFCDLIRKDLAKAP